VSDTGTPKCLPQYNGRCRYSNIFLAKETKKRRLELTNKRNINHQRIMMKQGATWKSQHENDGLSKYGNSLECPRDLVGYGNQGPTTVKWPNNAKVAINFVLNYEEGGESCVLHGDTHSEHLLSEIVGQQPYGTSHVFIAFFIDFITCRISSNESIVFLLFHIPSSFFVSIRAHI
jgi:hypothetical protein